MWKKRNCSKPWGHASKCDKKRIVTSLQYTAKNIQSAYKKAKAAVSKLTATAVGKGNSFNFLKLEFSPNLFNGRLREYTFFHAVCYEKILKIFCLTRVQSIT